MRKLYANLTREEADTYGLVLSASGLTCFQTKRELAGWSLWVTAAAHETARQNIEKYCSENPGLTPPMEPESSDGEKTFTALWVSLVLLASFLAIGSGETFRSIADLYGASAREILKGEVYRSATALMLHATPSHLAGNIAGLVLFGTAVCYIITSVTVSEHLSTSSCSVNHQSSIDDDHRTGHVGGEIRAQECYHRGDVIRLS